MTLSSLARETRPAFLMLVAFTLLTGVGYPLLVTAIGAVLFHDKAEGSLVRRDGTVVGSRLIAQEFKAPRYFWPRPSGAGFNAAASSGSNLAPSNPALVEAVKTRVSDFRNTDTLNLAPIPVDMVLASGSGLDPHISPEAATWQAPRIARERGMSLDQVLGLVRQHTEARTVGIFGEPRVNVLELNLALDGPGRP